MKINYTKFAFVVIFLLLVTSGLGCAIYFATSGNEDTDTLLLLQVVFRHGDRTAKPSKSIYPTDPYINQTFYPYGVGQLTKDGKNREYNLGKLLRKRYNDFLGTKYSPQLLYARTTDNDRTKMSLDLVLAGLFPPAGPDVWNEEFKWQPIPYNYVPEDDDAVLRSGYCPNIEPLKQEFLKKAEEQAKLAKYKDVFDYIANNTGRPVKDYENVADIYFVLQLEKEFGLKLPDWTNSVMPEPMLSLSVEDYRISTSIPDSNRIIIGHFMQEIIWNAESMINGTLSKGRKLFVYSGHESNIAGFLSPLGLFKPLHIPPYGSCIMIELHKINDKYGFKLYYENYSGDKPVLLNTPGCGEFCELDTFKKLVQPYWPKNDGHECGNGRW